MDIAAATNTSSTSDGNVVNDLGAYFLDLALFGASTATAVEEEEEEEAEPTELNTINSSGGFLVVSPDKLSVKYTSVNLHGHDVGVIQADKAAPVNRLVYYFEMCVKNAGVKGQMAIGFTNQSFKMRRQPGWEANSCGYHGDDGHLYRGRGKGDPFGPTFTTGDIVGSGINYASQQFFFTKNGTIIGKVYKDQKGPLFPTVAVHSQNEEVHVNFGKQKFAFDLKEYEAQQRNKEQVVIGSISVPPNTSHWLLRSYFLHYGYEDTLKAFDLASETTIPPTSVAQGNGYDEQDIVYALSQRKTIRQLIRKGEIDTARSKIRDWYPQLVQDDLSVTCFLLHCQKFIELVRVGALLEAVKYGRMELTKFFGLPVFEDVVQECIALLAYKQPQESSLGYLLEDSQRELVADTINAMILATNPNLKDGCGCWQSFLERLLRQLTTCRLERRSLNSDQGENFHLHRVLNTPKREKC